MTIELYAYSKLANEIHLSNLIDQNFITLINQPASLPYMSNRTAFEFFSRFFLTGRDREARAARQFDALEAAIVIAVIVPTRVTDAKLNKRSRDFERNHIH